MGVWARYGAEGDLISPIQPIYFEDIRLVPGKVVMVATEPFTEEWDHVKTYTFNNFVCFFIHYFFNIIIILVFLLVYISFLALLPLLNLILSSFLLLLFVIIIC